MFVILEKKNADEENTQRKKGSKQNTQKEESEMQYGTKCVYIEEIFKKLHLKIGTR